MIFLGAGTGVVFSVGDIGGFDVTLNLDGLTASLLDFLVKSWVLNSLMSSIAASDLLFVYIYFFSLRFYVSLTYFYKLLIRNLFLFDFPAQKVLLGR